MEIWKKLNIIGLEKYEVSNLGKVRNNKGKILSQRRIKNHLSIDLSKKGPNKSGSYLVHRLVALTFIEKPDTKDIVNHINNIGTDNRVENLEWVTGNENSSHYFSNFHDYKTERKTLSIYRLEQLYKSKNWESAEEFYKFIINKANESNIKHKTERNIRNIPL